MSPTHPHRRRTTLAGEVALDRVGGHRARRRTALLLHGEEGPASTAGLADHLGVEHRVIAPSGPGWDDAGRAAGPGGEGALARSCLDVLAAEQATDVVVVGVSGGGSVAVRAALDDVQGRVGALVLLGTARARARGRAGRVALDPVLLSRLATLTVPALVVRGSEDEVAGPAHGRAWADALGCDLVVVDGAGHLPFRCRPGMTFAALDAFLSAPVTLTA